MNDNSETEDRRTEDLYSDIQDSRRQPPQELRSYSNGDSNAQWLEKSADGDAAKQDASLYDPFQSYVSDSEVAQWEEPFAADKPVWLVQEDAEPQEAVTESVDQPVDEPTEDADDTYTDDTSENTTFVDDQSVDDQSVVNQMEAAIHTQAQHQHADATDDVAESDDMAAVIHTTVPEPDSPNHSDESERDADFDGTMEEDPRYKTMLMMMQYGRWPDVVEMIQELKRSYPDDTSLDSLLNEAQLKSDIVVKWGTSIKGRKMSVRHERFLRRSIPYVLLIFLAFIGVSFYQSFVAPSREVVAMSKEHKDIIKEAQAMTYNAQFQEALRLYEQILAEDPDNSAALQGIQETRDMMGLVAEFKLAMQLADEGNVERALSFLYDIQSKSPGFRNVDVEIKQLEALGDVQEKLETAEAAYAQQQWLTAIPLYQEIVELAPSFESETVSQHLKNAFYQAGVQLTRQLPSPDAGPAQAQEYLRKGKSVNPEQAETYLQRLEYYFDGMEALDEGRLEEAINLWQGMYDLDNDYLGGYLAGRLYGAYLTLASNAEQDGNLNHAQNLYEQAMNLKVDDVSSAQARLEAVRASMTPTPAPTVPPAAPVYVAPQPAAQPPTPTPEAVPVGWIAFRTTRNGPEEIYIMSPDGMIQKPAPASVSMRYEELLKDEAISWDGSRELRVLAIDGRTDASLYLVDTATGEQTMITNFHGDEYDPVWSPQGDRIAFVANHTGNDEIWTANPDGSDAYQVTWNEWEWDKRPSFSPDGSQIVFYSNRTGWKQIHVMDRNGGSQYNLSYNAYDDWDPVWIK